MIKTIGYTLFIICCISFLSILIIPLLGFTAKQVAGITVALIIIGEVTFYLSLLFLGKSFYNKIKSKLRFRKSADKDIDGTEKSEDKLTVMKSLNGQEK